MKPEILLGDEAVALGAIHAGLSAGYSYPGTPASEIMEYLIKAAAKTKSFVASWSVNEKVAYEEALGVSFAGKRALVSMKHVGLNVAADPFMNSALSGANGGLVVVPADDPGMHSSQNEQDSRFYADFAKIPCFEPSNHQEAYEMTRRAFDVSEELRVPVMVRLVTRLAHSRSTVRPGEPRGQNPLRHGASRDWTLLPVNARRRFQALLQSQADMVRLSEESGFNSLILSDQDRSLGVLAAGIAFNYVQENLPSLKTPPSWLKVCTYPVPEKLSFDRTILAWTFGNSGEDGPGQAQRRLAAGRRAVAGDRSPRAGARASPQGRPPGVRARRAPPPTLRRMPACGYLPSP
jgi:indolepyruvate ferredoxin oxidoreductase alpha subunit